MGAGLVRRLMATGTTASATTSVPTAVAAIEGRGARAPFVRGARRHADAPRAVWVMVPAGEITEAAITELAGAPRAGRHHHRRRQLLLPRRHRRTRRCCADKGIHFIDCGTSRRGVRLERGFCLMIGGEGDAVERLDPDLARVAPGHRGRAAHPGPHRRARARRGGLAALRPGRCRPLRQDGAQRHRVRADGRVRRGPEHPAQRRRGPAHARPPTPRPRRCPTREYYPLRARHLRRRRGVAARVGHRVVAAGPDGPGARRVPGARGVRGSGVGLGRGPLDRPSRRSRAACPHRC